MKAKNWRWQFACLLAALMSPMLSVGPAKASAVDGTWNIRGLVVHIFDCQLLVCGQIVSIKDVSRRASQCGKTIIWGLEAKGPTDWGGGSILDPNNGKTYQLSATSRTNFQRHPAPRKNRNSDARRRAKSHRAVLTMGQLGSVYLLSSQIVNFFRPPNMTRVPVLSFSGHCANDRGRRSLDFISDLVADGGDDARCRMHRLPDIDCLEALHRRAGAGRRASPAHDGGELNPRPRGLRII